MEMEILSGAAQRESRKMLPPPSLSQEGKGKGLLLLACLDADQSEDKQRLGINGQRGVVNVLMVQILIFPKLSHDKNAMIIM